MYRIETEALGQKVYKALRTMIITGELQPGQKLLQDELAERLGVSRTPLLSAFSKLEQENLVSVYPRRGVYIKKYSEKELLDICKIRTKLESLSAREAALTATKEDWIRLEAHLKNFDVAVEKNAESLLKQADYDFHVEILRCCGNTFLYNMLFSFIIIAINMSGLTEYIEQTKTEHHKLLDAIKARDPEQAEEIMVRHTEGPCQLLNQQK